MHLLYVRFNLLGTLSFDSSVALLPYGLPRLASLVHMTFFQPSGSLLLKQSSNRFFMSLVTKTNSLSPVHVSMRNEHHQSATSNSADRFDLMGDNTRSRLSDLRFVFGGLIYVCFV